ncbi:hypothetical protein [uncultured Pseudonocardia sp.]|uniref:hypothetical protein n=1 Tax=uncultured Pseudonocardia sp. TaxID=211455 RepID=UPI00260B7756|nr:hypothetical protein [uncultured Pseudonocardia sp.]
MTRPRLCAGCGTAPVAYYGREYCYGCVPRRRPTPPRCKRCGTTEHYFTAGLCRRCHRSGPWVDSCLDCLAWGATRHLSWLCAGCLGWRARFGPDRQPCPSCQRVVTLNARGFCRLCCRHAHLVRTPHDSVDVAAANAHGQQLFIADLFRQKRPDPTPAPPPRPWPARYPAGHRQLALLELTRDYSVARNGGLRAPLPDLAAALDDVVTEHAAHHGWRRGLTFTTRAAIRILLATQDTPGAPIDASHVAAVTVGAGLGNLKSVLEILTVAGMLHEDRESTLDAHFRRHTAELTDQIREECRLWFHALRDGSTTPPRRRPRRASTIRGYIAAAAPALRTWSDAGNASLREIDRDDVVAALPTDPVHRAHTLIALRSLFTFLKARRIVFLNPTARLRTLLPPPAQPLPMDLTRLRETITQRRPAQAALAALVAFHAPRVSEIRALLLTDLRDGRLHTNGRKILLAPVVATRLTAWLDERQRRWPNTVNPHLFINGHTAVRTIPVNTVWISATIGESAQAIRQDRILHEALTTAGDVRRLTDLFGISIDSAQRYAHTTDQPDTPPSSPTHDRERLQSHAAPFSSSSTELQ